LKSRASVAPVVRRAVARAPAAEGDRDRGHGEAEYLLGAVTNVDRLFQIAVESRAEQRVAVALHRE